MYVTVLSHLCGTLTQASPVGYEEGVWQCHAFADFCYHRKIVLKTVGESTGVAE